MRARYYVHMGPKVPEKVSAMWKVAHITLYFLLLCSSGVATACIYNILDMYKFHCILYAKVHFEQSYEERVKEMNETSIQEVLVTTNVTTGEIPANVSANILDCDKNPNDTACHTNPKKKKGRQDTEKKKEQTPESASSQNITEKLWSSTTIPKPSDEIHATGFLNMRKTIFATIYFCDLMLFAPLASIILAIFLGTLIVVGGKGGAGNPGDLLPNPWICVYPFLGLCCFMTVFSFIADNIYHKGLATFCLRYYTITKEKSCSKEMDPFNVQYTPDRQGPAKPFYMNYVVGSVGVQVTSALWVLQTLIYILRILCLADFQLYLTKIQLKDDIVTKDPKMGDVVMEMIMESKRKKN